ncbi:MAG: PKD domain-containing protein [Vicinamibacterales bacterium]
MSLAALSACDKVALLAPTGSTVTVNIDKTVVPIGGTAQVSAVVLESSGTAPQNGTMVTFTSSFGTMTPQEAPTEGGIARATFTGTGSGAAKINAFSGGAKGTEVEVLVGGAGASLVAMRSTPSSLPQGGGTVTITAVVRDKSGNTLPGAPVSFTTDQGNLGSTSALTDANGEAQTTLTTNRDAIVTATVIAGISATTTVRITSAPTVTIATTNASPTVGVGVNFTVTPGTAGTTGAPIQSGSVNFGDGTAIVSLGPISGVTSLTHVFSASGVYTVTASVVDATGQGASSTISVTVQRLAPAVTLTPATSTIAVGSALAFSTTATPGAGGPPVQSLRVTMNPGGDVLYSGTGSGSFTRQFNTQGIFTLSATATDTAGTIGTASSVVTVGGFDVTLDAAGSSVTNCSGTPKACTVPAAGASVTFTANVITPGITAASYAWDFGDGQTQNTTVRDASNTYAAQAIGAIRVATVTVTTTTGATSQQIVTLRFQ